MSEPNEPLKGLIVPNTGDLVGSWGTAALNPNFQAIGGMLGGVVAFSLSAATTIALTAPAGSITPGAGPTQQQNCLLSLSGAIAGTAIFQFSLPGFYIVDNQAGTSFPVILAPAVGTGTQIGAPWGRKCHIFFDGTNVDYANAPDPGTAMDWHGVTSIPNWMAVCTKPYALVKDGSSHSAATFPGLFNVIGTAFGGSGVSFNVPDERNRMRIPLDTNPGSGLSNRVTAAGSGINGTTMGAAGGDQLAQAHNHSTSEPGHTHLDNTVNAANVGFSVNGGNAGPFGIFISSAAGAATTTTTGIGTASITVNTALSGAGQNMPPAIVSFLALIKT